MKLLGMILIKFFLISALFIISNGNLHVGDPTERGVFLESYSIWVKGVYNQGAEIVGYIANSQWLPEGELEWIEPGKISNG